MASHPANVLSLCSGVGMLDLAIGLAFDARTVCYVEREAYSCAQLVNLMEAQCLDEAPVYADIATFDGKPWRGVVDIIVAGLPCQPYSVAGKRQGNTDKRSHGDGDGPIPRALRIIDEVRPAVVYLENVPAWVAARERWFQPVGERLCGMGYALQDPLFVTAASVGASHQRERVFIMAIDPKRGRGILRQSSWSGELAGPSDRLIQEPRRGSQGRNGVGSAEPVLDNATSARHHGTRIGTDTHSGGGQCVLGEGCADVGDAQNDQRWRELEAGRTGCGRAGLAGNGEFMAHTSSPRPQGSEQRGTRDTDRGGAEAHGSVSELCGIFAPGPSDSRWPEIIERYPWLAPATQPGVRGMVDGNSLVVDESRTNQLRAIGNGAVPLCFAAAVVILARRAGIVA